MGDAKKFLGVAFILFGLILIFGRSGAVDGSELEFWQKIQDHLFDGFLILIGIALIIPSKDD